MVVAAPQPDRRDLADGGRPRGRDDAAADRPGAVMLSRSTWATPVGELILVGSPRGLRHVLWAEQEPPETAALGSCGVLDEAGRQLDAYFAGDLRRFHLPLDLVGTEFQIAAWRALADIPYGTTISYGEQARRLGRPRAVRAVGAANGRNPLPIVLPCHRIVGADGSLVGFGGGLSLKRRLLKHEARFAPRR